MMSDMAKILKNMPESKLKKEYEQFMKMFASGVVPLIKILKSLDTKIKGAKESKNTTADQVSKNVVKFWERIRDLIIKTYKDNKELN